MEATTLHCRLRLSSSIISSSTLSLLFHPLSPPTSLPLSSTSCHTFLPLLFCFQPLPTYTSLFPPPTTCRRSFSSLTSCVSVSPSGRLSLSLRPSSLRPLLLLASLLFLLLFRSRILPLVSALLSLLLSLPLLFFRLLGFRWAEGDLSWGEWGWGSGGGRGRGRRVVRDRSMGGKEVVASEGWRKWWEGVGGGGESGRDGGKGMGVREGGVRRWRRGGGARQRGVSPLDIPAETSRSERELRALGLLAGEAGSGGRAGRLTGRQEEPAWWREACIGAAGMAASPAVAPDMVAAAASAGGAGREGSAAAGGAWSVAREGSEEAHLVVQREGYSPPAWSLPAVFSTCYPHPCDSRSCCCISPSPSPQRLSLPTIHIPVFSTAPSQSPITTRHVESAAVGSRFQRLRHSPDSGHGRLQLYTWSLPTRIPYPPFPLPPQLYTAYRRSGATVGIDSDNSRDALFRAAINTAFSAAAGWVHSSLIPSLPPPGHCMSPSPPSPHPFASFASHGHHAPLPALPPADIPLFLACLAAAVRLPSPRALTMVLAALAARTRSSFLQAWALVKQNRRSEAEEELQRLASIATTLPPPPNSAEMETVVANTTTLKSSSPISDASTHSSLQSPISDASTHSSLQSPLSDASTHSSLQSPLSDASTHSSLQSPISDASTHSSLQSPISDASTHSSL
ncbi:unnamed protein product [Closterium sp. NIES-64]|nr:unnamed protein product [Closterium sp. NIES-64]